MNAFLLLLVGPVLSGVVVVLLGRYFQSEPSASLRARLTTPGMRLFALVVAFSPVVTTLLAYQNMRNFPPGSAPFVWISVVLGSFGATALAACWLMLPRQPLRPLRIEPTIAVAFLFWFANWGALAVFSFVFGVIKF